MLDKKVKDLFPSLGHQLALNTIVEFFVRFRFGSTGRLHDFFKLCPWMLLPGPWQSNENHWCKRQYRPPLAPSTLDRSANPSLAPLDIPIIHAQAAQNTRKRRSGIVVHEMLLHKLTQQDFCWFAFGLGPNRFYAMFKSQEEIFSDTYLSIILL